MPAFLFVLYDTTNTENHPPTQIDADQWRKQKPDRGGSYDHLTQTK